MDLSFIIINYNCKELLRKCIHSIIKHAINISYEIIVVDNASSDGSVAMLKRAFPSLHLIENRENLGYATAINQGIRISKADYLVVMNNDVEILSNIFGKMLSIMESDSSIGILGCTCINPDGSTQKSFFQFPTLLSRIGILTSANTLFNKYINKLRYTSDTLSDVDYVLGALMLIRKSALEVTGVFDENYFLYHEEMDLCFRFKKRGIKVCTDRDARVLHYGHHVEDPRKSQVFIERNKNLLYFYKKNYGVCSLIVLILLNLFFFYIKLFYTSCISHDKAKAASYRQVIVINKRYCKALFSRSNYL